LEESLKATRAEGIHDLSTDGTLTLTAGDGDVIVTGTYSVGIHGIVIEEGYSGTITLDNVDIATNGTYDIYSTSSGPVTFNLVGNNKISGSGDFPAIFGGYNSSFIIDGSGSLSVSGIGSKELTINTPISITSEEVGLDVEKLVINADVDISAGYAGVVTYVVDRAYPLEINADITIVSEGSGILAESGISLNSGSIDVTYGSGSGIAWGDGSENSKASGTSVIVNASYSGNREGYDYAVLLSLGAKGGYSHVFAQRSSFLDTSTGGLPAFEYIEDGDLYTSDPADDPAGLPYLDLAAVVPDDVGWSLGDIHFRADSLDGRTITEFEDEIRVSSEREVSDFINDIPSWIDSTLWVDLHFLDNEDTGTKIKIMMIDFFPFFV
jgi:hypothetical protein